MFYPRAIAIATTLSFAELIELFKEVIDALDAKSSWMDRILPSISRLVSIEPLAVVVVGVVAVVVSRYLISAI
jgi:hypothetical protein